MAAKGPYHDKQFRRLTVAKIQEAVSADHSFVLEVGQRGPFDAVFVLPKAKHQDFDADSSFKNGFSSFNSQPAVSKNGLLSFNSQAAVRRLAAGAMRGQIKGVSARALGHLSPKKG